MGLSLALVLALARPAPALGGDLGVVLVDGSLVVTAGAGDEALTIVGIDADSVQVTPTAPTTLDGSADPQTFDGLTKDIVLALGLGTNDTWISECIIPGTLRAKGGAGNDTVAVSGSVVGGDITLDVGAGNNGLSVGDSTVVGRVTYRGDAVGVYISTVAGAVVLGLGAGVNTGTLVKATVGGKLSVKGGADEDTVMLEHSTLLDATSVTLGTGGPETLFGGNTFVVDTVTAAASLTYRGGRGQDSLGFTKVTTPARITVDGGASYTAAGFEEVSAGAITYRGTGFAEIHLQRSTVAGNLVASVGSGGRLDFFSSSVGGALAYTGGKGPDTVFMLYSSLGRMTADLGNGDNWFSAVDVNVLGPLTIMGKAGIDTVALTGSHVSGAAKLVLGAGSNVGTLAALIDGDLQVKTGAGDDQLMLQGTVVRGRQKIALGGGNDTVTP